MYLDNKNISIYHVETEIVVADGNSKMLDNVDHSRK